MITGPVYVQVAAGRFDRLNDAIFDPAPLAEQLDLARFQGRNDLIARIDERIVAQGRGYVVIRGEAGVGKSALAAHLAWTRPCAYHFTRLDGGARSPIEARKSLAAQLIGGWDLGGRFAPGDMFPAAADRPDWLAKVIRAAAAERDRRDPQRQPLVLVVDGLDEAEPDAPDMGTGIPLGLPTPDALPVGVYIVATSRYGLPLAALRDPQRVGWSQITVEGEDNLADMAAYLNAATTGPTPDLVLVDVLAGHGVPAEAFNKTLMDRCRGVWIYLRYVLDEIRAGLRPPDDVACLPDRLRGYYELQIRRWAIHPDWAHLHLPALGVLAALQRPATSGDLADILGIGRSTGAQQLAPWLDGPARAFLDVITGVDRQRTYRVRHQSLRDLFTAHPHIDPEDEDPVEAGLSDQLYTVWTAAHQAITRWLTPQPEASGRRDWTRIDDYTRLQLPAHAAAGATLDPLMSDPDFLLTCPAGQILRHRHALVTREGLAVAAALEAAANEWAARPETDRSWWLHVSARKTRAVALADALAAQEPAWPWTAQAAFWSGITHRTFIGHTREVSAVAVLPSADGGHRIVSGGDDGSVRVWDPDSGSQVAMLTGHTSGVRAVTVLPRPDGRHHIVSGGDDGSVRVWDPDSGSQVAMLTGHTSGVRAVTVLPRPDGRHHIVSGGDRSVRVWDPDTATQVIELTRRVGEVWAVAVLPTRDGQHRIVAGYNRGPVRVWDPDSGAQVTKLTGHTRGVRAVTVLPTQDGRHRIISGSDDRSLRVWDPDSGTQVTKLTGHAGAAWALAVWPDADGRQRIVSGGDRSVRAWDAASGAQVVELSGHTGAVRAVAVLPTQDSRRRIVSGCNDGSVRVWDPDSSRRAVALTGHTGALRAVAVLPGQRGRHRIVSGCNDGSVRVWDPDTGTQAVDLAAHIGAVWALTVLPDPDGRHLIVSAGNDGAVRVWNPDTGTQAGELTGHSGAVWAVTVLPYPNGRHRIVSAGHDGSVRVWDPDTGRQTAMLTGHHRGVRAVAVLSDPDGQRRIVTGSDDKSVRVWDPDAGIQVAKLPGHPRAVRAVVVLPDPGGRHRIVSGSDDGSLRVRVWNPDRDTQVVKLTGHTDLVSALAVLPGPDGRHRIVSASYDGSVRMWDADSGAQVDELTGHVGAVRAVAVLPGLDGRHRIVTGGNDRSVMAWAQASDNSRG